jgi:hypothetical protein
VAAQANASRGPAWPGMVSYGRTGTGILRVLPLRRPDGGYETLYLDSGQNPPYGVVVHYHLPAPAPDDVTLTFLDGDGRELRSFDNARDRLPANAGINRFLWNRRLAGAPHVLAPDLEPFPRSDGPMVVPGRYAVRLTADARSQTQPFDILPDPRVKTSAGELAEQFVFLEAILQKIVAVNTTINEIDALLEALPHLDRRIGKGARPAALRKASQALGKELVAIRRALIDVNYSQAQHWGSGLHEKFNALFDTVDSADFAPARQTREVFDVLSSQLDALLARWRKAREQLLPALNRAVAEAKLPIIG